MFRECRVRPIGPVTEATGPGCTPVRLLGPEGSSAGPVTTRIPGRIVPTPERESSGNCRAPRGKREHLASVDRSELETLMGNEAPDRPVAMADYLNADPTTTTVSSFVVEARRRGIDPSPLLDADFLLRGED